MRKIGDILTRFKLQQGDDLQWIKTLFLVILLADVINDPFHWTKFPLVFSLFLGTVSSKKILNHPLYWSILLIFLPFVKVNYAVAANHHFLEFYFIVVFLLQTTLHENFTYIKTIFKWMFTLLMGIACMYKLATPEVLNGSSYHLMWATGHMFEHLSTFLMDDYTSIVEENRAMLSLLQNDYSQNSTRLLSGSEILPGLFFFYAWIIILFELVLVFIFWTPYKLLAQALTLIFVLFVPLATWESTFLCLVALLAMGQTETKKSLFYSLFSSIILIYISIIFKT